MAPERQNSHCTSACEGACCSDAMSSAATRATRSSAGSCWIVARAAAGMALSKAVRMRACSGEEGILAASGP